jgi:isoquinoline 1-oxidoreductase beta subunit
VNQLGIAAQRQGGTIDGLSTVMNLEISIDGGHVVQSNLDDYPLATALRPA